MDTAPLLSLLMPALHCRDWERQRDDVISQMKTMPEGVVEFLYDVDGGEATSGCKRQRLMERSSGLYVACIDDDDELSSDYLVSLLNGCNSVADVVSFVMNVRNTDTGRRERWKLGLWPDARLNGRMTVNHLCAWRRDIARRVAWCPSLGYGDDQLWYKPLLAAGLVKTEHHIDRALINYIFNPKTSANQQNSRIEAARAYVGHGLGCYRDAAGAIYMQVGGGAVTVRDCCNTVTPLRSDMIRISTVKLA